jgi:6-phosphogluconolactonase
VGEPDLQMWAISTIGAVSSQDMSFSVETLPVEKYADRAADIVAQELSEAAAFVLTGGTTAERVYEPLARLAIFRSGANVFFSDERCVDPQDPRSNYGMVQGLLDLESKPLHVHRMRGELSPERGAESYERDLHHLAGGVEVLLLGMGADCHIAALFPGSDALAETSRGCVAVERPDGLEGLTLTPPVLSAATKVPLVVTGKDKAPAVDRAVNGRETIAECPARLLADHPRATFVVDAAAAEG